MRAARRFLFLLCLLPISAGAQEDAFGPDKLAEHLRNATPVDRPIPVTNLEEAYRYQDRFVELQSARLGDRVGYKAALTSDALQKRFRYDRPVLGVVMRDMLLRDRVSVDEQYAARPMIEADLMAVVKDEAINDAATDEELLNALEGIHPLIELPDLVFVKGTDILPLWITAINAGACKAVVGDPVLIDGDPAWLEKLSGIHASILDRQGQVLQEGTSDRLLGNPIHVVRWIRDEVKSRGGTLRAGEVLWLGSLTDLIPATAGESYQVVYTGLGEYPLSIQVNIRKTPKW